jgi:hypothetical protein
VFFQFGDAFLSQGGRLFSVLAGFSQSFVAGVHRGLHSVHSSFRTFGGFFQIFVDGFVGGRVGLVEVAFSEGGSFSLEFLAEFECCGCKTSQAFGRSFQLFFQQLEGRSRVCLLYTSDAADE